MPSGGAHEDRLHCLRDMFGHRVRMKLDSIAADALYEFRLGKGSAGGCYPMAAKKVAMMEEASFCIKHL